MAVAGAWVQSLEITARPSETDIRRFFNIPPDGEERLDGNISRKRRAWNAKLREQKASAAAERKVRQALALIAELERRVKRGIVDDEIDLELLREEFHSATPDQVNDLDELWRILDELLAAGKLPEALATARDALQRWSDEPTASAAFAWLAMIASRSDENTTDALRRAGLDAARAALAGGVRTADTYKWHAVLQLDLGDYAGAVQTLRTAEEQLAPLGPWLVSHRCEALVGTGDIDAAMRDGIRAVAAAGDDEALRSNTAAALVRGLRALCLPITTKDQLKRYLDVVQVAAWCADGVPEAEDHVRPFRLWAVQASARHYVGRWDIRSLAAVASGFLLLPMLNRWKSKPVWQVFYEGPDKHGEDWQLVSRSWFVRVVHDGIAARLPWNPEAMA
jgi:tetratricopeptide (TPR) repeat protein